MLVSDVALEQRVEELEDQVEKLQEEVDHLESEIRDLEKELRGVRNDRDDRDKSLEEIIAICRNYV